MLAVPFYQKFISLPDFPIYEERKEGDHSAPSPFYSERTTKCHQNDISGFMDITIRSDYFGSNFFVNDDVTELVPYYPKHSLREITKKKKGRTRDKDFLLSSLFSLIPFKTKKSRKAPLVTFLDSFQSYSCLPHFISQPSSQFFVCRHVFL